MIIDDGGQLPAHSCILAAVSPALHELLKNGERIIKIPATTDTVSSLLVCLYTQQWEGNAAEDSGDVQRLVIWCQIEVGPSSPLYDELVREGDPANSNSTTPEPPGCHEPVALESTESEIQRGEEEAPQMKGRLKAKASKGQMSISLIY